MKTFDYSRADTIEAATHANGRFIEKLWPKNNGYQTFSKAPVARSSLRRDKVVYSALNHRKYKDLADQDAT